MKICRCSIIYGLMILILSCTPDVTTERADENGDSGVERAVLTIHLGNGSDTASSNGKAMTVVPSPSLIKSYRVTMTNGSVTKTYDMDTSSETFYDLPTGSCSITVNGYSGTGQSGSVIASGTATATLAAGGNSVNITMSFMQTAVTGMGGYSLTVEFPAGAADGLTYSFNGGAFTTAPFTGSPTATATITGSDKISGSYDLVLKFTKGSATTGVYREAVNIYDNVTSNKWINPDGSLADKRVFGSSDFADTNASLADLKLTRTYSFVIPLNFGFTSAGTEYTTGGPFDGSNVTLQPTGSVAGQYIQYKVGTGSWAQIKSGETLTIGGSLSSGATTDIVVIVTAPDGVSYKVYTIHYDRDPPIAPVTGSTLYADGIASTQVKLRWTEPADSDYAGMIVSYGSPATAYTTDKGTTSYLAGSLTSAITSFSVKSVDLYGNESAPVTINRPAEIGFITRDFNNANKTMTLTWNDIAGATGYEIEYTDSVTHIVTSTSETCTVTGLKGGYRYAFTVRAVYSYGKSYGNTTPDVGSYYCAGNNPLNVTAVTAGAGQSITVSGTLPADPNITGVTVTYNGTDTTVPKTSGSFSVTTANSYNTLNTTISYKVNYNNSGTVFSGDSTSKTITTWSNIDPNPYTASSISKLCINPSNNSPYLVFFQGSGNFIHYQNGTIKIPLISAGTITCSDFKALLAIAPNGTIYQGLVTYLGYGTSYGKYIYRGSNDISSSLTSINTLNVTIDAAPSGSAYLTDIDSSKNLDVYKKPAGSESWVALSSSPLLTSISDAVVKCAPDGTPWLVVHQKIGTAPTYVRVYRFSNVWVEVGSSFHNYGGGNIKCLPVFDTSGTPYIIGNFNMFKYNGSGWENPPLGSISCIPTSIVASPDTAGVLYFSCEYGTDFRVYKYTDGAANPLTLMGSFSDYKQDGSVAVAPDGTLYAAYVTTGDAIAIWKL